MPRLLNATIISTLLLLLSIAFVTRSMAETSSDSFLTLMKQAIASQNQMDTPVGTFRTLTLLTPNDTKKTHQADYFSVVGAQAGNGFAVSFVSIVSESWVLNETDNTWTIDQYIFEIPLTENGHSSAEHNRLREDANGIVLPSDEPPPLSQAEAKAKFLEVLARFTSNNDTL